MRAIVEDPAYSSVALDVFRGVLAHVDRLNSFVRSQAFRRGYIFGTSEKHVVYHLKNEAIKQAQALGLASHSLIALVMRCRDCGGTGHYTDQYDFIHPHCRLCSSTGRVKLRFISTVIEAAGVHWYSPTGYRYQTSHFPPGWESWPEQSPGDWMPGQEGKDLTPDEVAESLIAAETFFPERPRKRWVTLGDYDSMEVDDFASYHLYVGTTMEGVCCLCLNAEPVPGCMRCRIDRLEWRARVCKDCRDLSSGTTIWDRLQVAVPTELLTASVIAWRDSHAFTPRK